MMEPETSVVLPLTVTVGTPARAFTSIMETIVGNSAYAEASQFPSTKRIEFAPTSERPDRELSIVTEEVRFWRSSINGSWGLVMPRT